MCELEEGFEFRLVKDGGKKHIRCVDDTRPSCHVAFAMRAFCGRIAPYKTCASSRAELCSPCRIAYAKVIQTGDADEPE